MRRGGLKEKYQLLLSPGEESFPGREWANGVWDLPRVRPHAGKGGNGGGTMAAEPALSHEGLLL